MAERVALEAMGKVRVRDALTRRELLDFARGGHDLIGSPSTTAKAHPDRRAFSLVQPRPHRWTLENRTHQQP
ncbi:hypothetical protein V1290_003805 [Bradyrhizobium sp. AZCC 1578]|uniref:hypothetical protein n=1 Tax=Bradyrhizobium sp. AZCC 1578 TaxID=3117027 RepID=UPI002FF29D5D